MRMHKSIWWVFAAALLVAGCAGKGAKSGGENAEMVLDGSSAGQNAGTGTGGTAEDSVTSSSLGDDTVLGPQGGLLSKRIVYFAFDRAEIRSEDTAVIAAHAQYLVANPATRVRLEGHTDERGTREYNIGLGERRAQAVRRAMALQGVADSQLSTVSYGEERPAAAGSDEVAWAQNRRVEIVYLN